MAVLALNTSSHRNAVSRLHRTVSQEMWHDLWPELPVWEVPITSITNGVHLPSWLNADFAQLYDQYLQPEWRDRFSEPEIWQQVDDIPDEELFEAHRRRKRRLVGFVRARQVQSAMRRQAPAAEIRRAGEVLDPNAFTIGFSRRFATYKRATLIFRDVERLKKILCNPDRPVQIIIAGKAHPKDSPGKTLIREIVQYSRDPELWKHVVFLEDYDMKVARELVQGVDLWLNNPRRGEEACGTSGMKAGINGVLNLSILDGWWDEAAEFTGGWTIGDREPYSEDQDALHASAIYYLLENEIVPLFFENREHTPREWIKRVKKSLQYLSYQFDARRMVSEYMSELYHPAHHGLQPAARGRFPGGARPGALERPGARRCGTRCASWKPARRRSEPSPAARPVPVRAAVELAGSEAGRRARRSGAGARRDRWRPGRYRSAGAAADRAERHRRGVRQRHRAGAHGPAGLCAAHQSGPLRGSADAALHQPFEMGNHTVIEHATQPAALPPTPLTIEGASVLHQMLRIRWAAWRSLGKEKQAELIAEAAPVLAEIEKAGSAVFSLLGHKGDLMLVHFRAELRAAQAGGAAAGLARPVGLSGAHDVVSFGGGARALRFHGEGMVPAGGSRASSLTARSGTGKWRRSWPGSGKPWRRGCIRRSPTASTSAFIPWTGGAASEELVPGAHERTPAADARARHGGPPLCGRREADHHRLHRLRRLGMGRRSVRRRSRWCSRS